MQTNKNGAVVNAPQFKVYGEKRRELKKKLGKLKSFISGYQTEEIYFTPGEINLNDKEKHKIYHQNLDEIKSIEAKLREPYKKEQ